jgi:hypothetical protein
MKLGDSVSGVWADDRSCTLEVVSPRGKIGIEQLCGGELSRRMWFTYRIGGKDVPYATNCAVWEEGPYPMATREFSVPRGERVTITGRVGLRGEYTNRPVRWPVAVYVK